MESSVRVFLLISYYLLFIVCVSPLNSLNSLNSQNQSQNHQFNGVIHSSDIKHQTLEIKHDNNPGSGSGYVSLSHLPSQVESGSSAQFSNITKEAKGNSEFDLFLFLFDERFPYFKAFVLQFVLHQVYCKSRLHCNAPLQPCDGRRIK